MSESFNWTFSRGAIYDRNRVYVLAYSKREAGTRVFRWTDGWDNYYVGGISGGICSVAGKTPEIVTMCVDGLVHSASPNGFSSAYIDEGPEAPQNRGILRDLRLIDGHLYVAGLGRQVYRREQSGNWVRFDARVLDPLGSNEIVGFQSIDGFSTDEIYGVGLNGEIWVCDRSVWRQLDSPSNLILEKILCAPDGYAYVAGQLGTIIRGRGDSWEQVINTTTEENFWDITWFDDRLWLSTDESLFVLQDHNVHEVDMKLSLLPSCRYLDSNGEVLWSFGSSDIIRFDGAIWTEVPKP